jgi:HYDIN/CFA65/VesB-like, Ig-like domain
MTNLSRTDGNPRIRLVLMLALVVAVSVMPTVTVYGATFVIDAGSGFDGPEAREPVGGNNGATLGQQRLNALNLAANLWGEILQSPINIVIQASFTDLECGPLSGILGGAGPNGLSADFSEAPKQSTWYPDALADALSGTDLNPGFPDIRAQFNARLDDGDSSCLNGKRWYYGFDHNSGDNVDFLNVIMHEIAHGLGFASFTNETTGRFTGGMPSIYDVYIRDLTQGVTWSEMSSDALRRTSAINTGHVVWDGPLVNAQTSFLSAGLGPNGAVLLYAPNPVEPGSSISHWDTSLTPDTLMEPFISTKLRASDGVDLTPCLLADIGWTLNLTGSCLHLPDIFLATNAIHFGNQVLDTPRNETLVISNNGSVDLKLGSVAMNNGLMPPFTLSSDHCTNQTLAGGATCSLVVQFLPLTEGSFSDSFDIPSNDSDTPSAVITLTGSGVTPHVSADSGGGGGCTLTHRQEFDPLFGLLLLAAGLHFARCLIKHVHKL